MHAVKRLYSQLFKQMARPLQIRSYLVSSQMCSDLKVNLLGNADVTEVCSSMDYLSANRIDGNIYFGQDEFPTKQSKEDLLKFSRIYSVFEKSGGTIGYILVTPSHIFRHHIATYADIRIAPYNMPGKLQYQPNYFTKLLHTAVELTSQLNYEALVYQSFISNVNMIHDLKKCGFTQMAVIPRSGYTYDMGWQESVLFMKTLKNIQVSSVCTFLLHYCIRTWFQLQVATKQIIRNHRKFSGGRTIFERDSNPLPEVLEHSDLPCWLKATCP
jgi:hypothetical protein